MMMNKYILTGIILTGCYLLTTTLHAKPISQHHILDLDSALCAGFRASAVINRPVTLTYPSVLNSSWFAVGTSVEILRNGTPTWVTQTRFESSMPDNSVVSMAFFDSTEEYDAKVTISYQCKNECPWPYKQLITIPSINKMIGAPQPQCAEDFNVFKI